MNKEPTSPASDATPCSLPPHKAEKGFLTACYGTRNRWWRLYTTDGQWTQIGPGGATLKLARQHALDEIREANVKVHTPLPARASDETEVKP